MRRQVFTMAAAAALVALVGCGGETAPEEPSLTDEEIGSPTDAATEVPAEPLPWGEAATVLGDNGTEVELVPVAIRYYDGEGLTEEDMAPSGVYVIVQFDATALTSSESLSWVDGTGFTWRADGQQLGRSDSGDPPWTGHEQGFYGEPFLPDEGARSGLVYFDIPEQGAGNLSYVDDMAGTVIRWEVPGESEGDEGPLWDDVDAAIAEWS
ncbi:hypothetical protein [Nocardiopsis sp. NRRL B-16309]|uniref:hypothetical protein n=1 Tax=Nocardiopsis sp. NRRL B-16309 TaxID=1519494 RepID=UPI0006AF99FF|nr:hypothetical protein [Nocardiopsis sp. NRRL B-16309]KOX17516.1 hypothetical protein ADL05_09100 [Nocardiopsis sp. NRRL B-16309]